MAQATQHQVGSVVVTWAALDSLPVGSMAVSAVAYFMRVPGGVVCHNAAGYGATNFYTCGSAQGAALVHAATVTHVA